MYTAFRYTFRASLALNRRGVCFCFCPSSHKSPARHHVKVTFRRIVAACLGGCSLSGDGNENRGATHCQLLMLIGSDLCEKKTWPQSKAASGETALEEACHKITFEKGKAAGWILALRVEDGNHDSWSRPNRWGQIIIKAAEPESWYCVFLELQGGRHWQFKALQSARKQRSSVEMHLQAPDY